MVVPVFLPHLGCAGRCIYCHQGYITDAGDAGIQTRIDAAFAGRTEPCDVGLFGGNIFGIAPDVLARIFSFFEPYRTLIRTFRLSTKPVPLRDETIALLKKNGVGLIELGIPTFNHTILAALNRAHTGEDLFRAYGRLKNEGFTLALFRARTGLDDQAIAAPLERAIARGWLAREDGERIRPTELGLRFANDAIALFL